MNGPVARAREALGSRDFRWLLALRLASQLGDGLFQAFLIDTLVFLSPEEQSTAFGIAVAFAVLILPFSLVGPFTGVVIDRQSRRRILLVTPLIRAFAALLLVAGAGGPATTGLYVLAVVVVSLNRFYLATAGAVIPALVPDRDLLVANSMAGATGTVMTFAGLVAGTQIAGGAGPRSLLAIVITAWVAGAVAARAIRDPLLPGATAVRPRADLARAAAELWRAAGRLRATPPALGSIVSISVDQFLVALLSVLSVVVFRDRFQEGIAAYGRIISAGGVGVLLGLLTVGLLERRLAKPRIVALAFAVAGAVCLAGSVRIGAPTILLISFALGLTYPWRKVPADTIVQETIPDRFLGRVFALYDMAFAMPRVLAGALAVPLLAAVEPAPIVAAAGVAYAAWAPALPLWVRRRRPVGVRFYAGGRDDEVPRAVRVGLDEEPVEVLGSWTEEREATRVRRFRLRTPDGTRLEVVGTGEGPWFLEREVFPERRSPPPPPPA